MRSRRTCRTSSSIRLFYDEHLAGQDEVGGGPIQFDLGAEGVGISLIGGLTCSIKDRSTISQVGQGCAGPYGKDSGSVARIGGWDIEDDRVRAGTRIRILNCLTEGTCK